MRSVFVLAASKCLPRPRTSISCVGAASNRPCTANHTAEKAIYPYKVTDRVYAVGLRHWLVLRARRISHTSTLVCLRSTRPSSQRSPQRTQCHPYCASTSRFAPCLGSHTSQSCRLPHAQVLSLQGAFGAAPLSHVAKAILVLPNT